MVCNAFEVVTVVLPPAGSPLGTRETLYTAATRVMRKVRLIGAAEAAVAACGRPAARADGVGGAVAKKHGDLTAQQR